MEKLRNSNAKVVIVGAGLAGCEAAWQLARRGHSVVLIEQRPIRSTEAHTTDRLGELVCSNSLKSTEEESAPALLKDELAKMNSLILKAAYASQIPAGQALAVDRVKFANEITKAIESNANIELIREPLKHYKDLFGGSRGSLRPAILATGPLTSEDLSHSLKELIQENLYFYDAIAPIVDGSTIDQCIAFRQNRYDKNTSEGSDGDYLNCPLTKEEYFAFIEALGQAEKLPHHEFEKALYFQGCQPIEALLEKGPQTLAFGPMKPKGLIDPRTGHEPYACLQLRMEDSEGKAWNLVGFQTKMKYPEQKRVFRMIPGLQNAEFFRFGSLHRNTYINSPTLLDSQFRLKAFPALHFAGQITGVEGYLESTAIGALVGRLIALRLEGFDHGIPPPQSTAIGALAWNCYNGRVKNFQPMNINWGLIPLGGISERDPDKKKKLVANAKRQFQHWLALFGE